MSVSLWSLHVLPMPMTLASSYSVQTYSEVK